LSYVICPWWRADGPAPVGPLLWRLPHRVRLPPRQPALRGLRSSWKFSRGL